jgi:hypothetical protein
MKLRQLLLTDWELLLASKLRAAQINQFVVNVPIQGSLSEKVFEGPEKGVSILLGWFTIISTREGHERACQMDLRPANFNDMGFRTGISHNPTNPCVIWSGESNQITFFQRV